MFWIFVFANIVLCQLTFHYNEWRCDCIKKGNILLFFMYSI